MAKKVLSFFLATMLIMSVLSVSAVEANPVTFYTDGFETGAIAADGSYSSDVWALTDAGATTQIGSSATKNATIAIVEQGTAPNINKVLEVSRTETGGFHLAMNSSNVTLEEGTAVYAGFKAMFTGYPGTAKNWLVGVGRTPLLKLYPGWVNYAVTDTQGPWHTLNEVADTKQIIEYNTWITVVMKITGTTAQAWLYDENGLLLTTTAKTGTFKGYPSIFHPNEGGAENVKLYIDDGFYGLVSDDNTMALVSSTLNDNATNVALTNQNIDLKFDMPVGVLEDGDITCNGATVEAERVAYDTIRVNLSGLANEANYTLDFSNVEGMSGNALTGKNTISFTTMPMPANPATIYTDGFETGAVSGGTYASSVWAMNDSTAATSAGQYSDATVNSVLTIIEDSDNADNHIMEISRESSGGFHIPMIITNNTIPENKTIHAGFRFKINEFCGSAKQWLIGLGRTPLIKVAPGHQEIAITDTQGSWSAPQEVTETKQYIDYGSWISVMMEASSTTAQMRVYDASGNMILETKERTGSFRGCPSIFHPNETGATKLKMYIDDSYYALVGADNTMSFTGSSVAAGATNVELLDQTIDLTFDLPILASTVENITLNGVAAEAKQVDFDTVRVTLPGILKASTDYTLNFADVQGLSGNALYGTKTLSFTTKAYADDFIVRDIGSIIVSGSDVPPAQRITVANIGAAKADVDFIVAFYSNANTLIGAQWVTDVDFDAQATATLNLANDGYVYRNVQGIRVFAFSSDSELKPLFSGATYGNLWD